MSPRPTALGASRSHAAPTKESTRPSALGFRMPAEWGPHAATWMAWPHKKGDWPGKTEAIPWVFAEVVRQLSRGERVRLLVASKAEQHRAERILRLTGVDLAQVDFISAQTDRSWTRDYIPLFVARRPPRSGLRSSRAVLQVAAVKWRFNGWARYPDHRLDDAAGHRAAAHLGAHCFLPVVDARGRAHHVVLEGGAVDVDGQGTVLTSEDCLLTGRYARNRCLGRRQLEQILCEFLGIERVLWLGAGIAGDDTAGHVDDFVRFVAPGRVILCEEKRRADPNHRALELAREMLENQRDARGRKLELVRLPMPEPRSHGHQRLPASYANFYIGNEAVLVPTFNDETDRVALGIIGELFPNRRAVGIHAVDLVLGLGTVHCSTQQEPAGMAWRRGGRAEGRTDLHVE
jgi:agmatine deiminase